MEALFAAAEAVKSAVPGVVLRYRSEGYLTWALLHCIESEVIADVVSKGVHSRRIVDMLSAPKAICYPTDDRQVSFEGHGFVPIIFGAIVEVWNRVN